MWCGRAKDLNISTGPEGGLNQFELDIQMNIKLLRCYYCLKSALDHWIHDLASSFYMTISKSLIPTLLKNSIYTLYILCIGISCCINYYQYTFLKKRFPSLKMKQNKFQVGGTVEQR